MDEGKVDTMSIKIECFKSFLLSRPCDIGTTQDDLGRVSDRPSMSDVSYLRRQPCLDRCREDKTS